MDFGCAGTPEGQSHLLLLQKHTQSAEVAAESRLVFVTLPCAGTLERAQNGALSALLSSLARTAALRRWQSLLCLRPSAKRPV